MKAIAFLLVFVSLFFYTCTNLSNHDTGWRGPNRDGVVKDFNVPVQWPDELKRVWASSVGLCDASPILTGNRLYMHVRQDENEVTLCLNAETGDEIWRTINNVAPEVTGGPSAHSGPRSTPFSSGGKIFTLGVGGAVTCLDAETGKIIWLNNDYADVPEFYAAMSPLVAADRCFVHLGGRETGSIGALNASTGKKIWELDGHPSTYSSPLIMKLGDERVLLVQTESHLIGVSMDGRLLWQIPTPGERRFYNASTPVVHGHHIVIAGQGLGTRLFKVEKSGHDYVLAEQWSNPEYGVSFNTPVLKDGHLYGHEARLGKIYCLNFHSGKTCWADTISHNRFASLQVVGKDIVSLTANGKLIVYEINPDRYVEKAAYSISDTEVYAHPVLAGNKIFTKDKENLVCWQVN